MKKYIYIIVFGENNKIYIDMGRGGSVAVFAGYNLVAESQRTPGHLKKALSVSVGGGGFCSLGLRKITQITRALLPNGHQKQCKPW